MRLSVLALTLTLLMLASMAGHSALTKEATNFGLAPFYLVWLGPHFQLMEGILPLNEMGDGTVSAELLSNSY